MKRGLGILAGTAAAAAVLFYCRPRAGDRPLTESAPSAPRPIPPAAAVRTDVPRNDSPPPQTSAPEDPVLLRLREQAAAVAGAGPDQTESAWETLINSFSVKEIPPLLDRLTDTRDVLLAEFRRLLVRRWAAFNPSAAAVWAFSQSDLSVQQESLRQVAVVWYQNRPDEALAWAAQMLDGEGKSAAVVSLGYELAREKPVAALQLAGLLTPGGERDEMVVHGVCQWAADNPSAAARWAVQIPDEALRQKAVAAACISWAGSNSVEAASFAVHHLPPGAEQERTVVSIVQRWAQTSPQAAVEWVAQFPAVPLRYAALQNLVAIWTEQDPESPVNWLRGLPSSALRDESISVYAQSLAPRSYQSAQIWAAAIEDASRRAFCRQAISRFAP